MSYESYLDPLIRIGVETPKTNLQLKKYQIYLANAPGLNDPAPGEDTRGKSGLQICDASHV